MEKKPEKQTPETLALWDQLRAVPNEARKTIKGGRLNGMTDINPVWRMKMLTQVFGQCGIGWTIREVERWTNEAAGEIGAFVKVELRVNLGDKWSEPIEGTGGSKLCGKGHGDGLNDEAWKMATTDAISVACKSLGMAADIYFEKDADYGTKYEPRNYAQERPRNNQAGNYTSAGSYGREMAPQSQPAPNYQQAPAPAPVYQQPLPQPAPAQPAKKTHIIYSTVTTGRCRSIIAAQARRDFDDLVDWQAGLDAICAKYDVDPDALKEIEKRAVALRQANQQQQIGNLNLNYR